MDKHTEKVYRNTLDAITDIDACVNGDEVFAVFQEHVKTYGAISTAIGQIVNPIIKGKSIDEFGWHDWPEEWANRYSSNDYVLHDPVSQFALKTRHAFEWITAKNHASRFGRKIMDEGSEFAFKNGITIPVQVGHKPIGLISLGFGEELPETSQLSALELVSIHCYTKLLSFYDLGEAKSIALLTKREIDVLSFVAIGKSNWEISRVLGIAESSAIQHVKNISRKLQAANRTHAVTLAIQSGQIIP